MKEIRKVLIANRGEIACRIMRTLDRLGIPSVLICHPCEIQGPAARLAPEVVEIDGDPPVSAYLDVEEIIKACKTTGADAVHPGFGFLAENSSFAERLKSDGISFIGPKPESIELMGNKLKAREFCISLGIPVVPAEQEGRGFISRLKALGFPILLKAAAGGGGKAMHEVMEEARLKETIKLAKEEALRYFGEGSVYGEKLLRDPRHVEVQILADRYGSVVHLGERDCSIQRRFQKIIEESPAPGLEPELRQELLSSAVKIAKEAGYENAGTVEFLLNGQGRFYFLEMNTRIQVEHPVTEMVTGLDLVEQQIKIAAGEPLFFTQKDIIIKGHAVEARLYAEDPESDFQPSTGRILILRLPEGSGIRVDHALEKGMNVTHAFDPMLAKIIAHGQDRQTALDLLGSALGKTVILGVTTNREFLERIVGHPTMRAGDIHTGFIASNNLKAPQLEDHQREMLLAAAALVSRQFTDQEFAVSEPYAAIGDWIN